MELFRSESMRAIRLTITSDAAHHTIREIGKVGAFHLVDLNGEDAVATETFVFYKKRVAACSYWEKKLENLEKAMSDHDVAPPPVVIETEEYTGGDLITAVKVRI